MLLVELNLPSGLRRVSNEPLALDHWWSPSVASLSSIKIATQKPWGGWMKPIFGSIDLIPDVFDADWPPPISFDITIRFGSAGESGARIIFEGTAHRQTIKRDGILYRLYGQEYKATVTQSYKNPLHTIFANHCATLGLTLDLSGTSRNPDVDYVTTGERILINDLSDMAAFCSHGFYIESGVLYLVDMLADNGTVTWTEYDFFPSQYPDPVPVAELTAGTESLSGSAAYGATVNVSPVCHTAAANIQAVLADIKTLAEQPAGELHKPLSEPLALGTKIAWIDASLHAPINVWIRQRGITFDFDREFCVVEGGGGIS